MNALVLAAMLPMLYWQQGIESAKLLKQAGIDRFCVPPAEAEVWRKAGFSPVALSVSDLEARAPLPAPRVAAEVQVASATRSPWLIINGWRFIRNHSGKYFYELPKGTAALAAAEAFAYDVDAILKMDPDDLEDVGRMFAFLRNLKPESLNPLADLALVEDGSEEIAEVMNLLTRRNLLFKVVSVLDPQYRINIQLGTKEYPRDEAANPSDFALKVRRQLGDENRLLRLYGSEVVISRLTGDGSRLRLHLLNYGGGKVEGLRVRLRGSYPTGEVSAAGYKGLRLEDHVIMGGVTEFSVPEMRLYAVVDLQTMKQEVERCSQDENRIGLRSANEVFQKERI